MNVWVPLALIQIDRCWMWRGDWDCWIDGTMDFMFQDLCKNGLGEEGTTVKKALMLEMIFSFITSAFVRKSSQKEEQLSSKLTCLRVLLLMDQNPTPVGVVQLDTDYTRHRRFKHLFLPPFGEMNNFTVTVTLYLLYFAHLDWNHVVDHHPRYTLCPTNIFANLPLLSMLFNNFLSTVINTFGAKINAMSVQISASCTSKLQLVQESVLRYRRRLASAAQDLIVTSQLYNNLVCNCQRV